MSGRKRKESRRLAWLIYAVVVTALMSATTLSRYMTTVTGTGTAAVARVVLDGTLPIDVSGMQPDTTRSVSFSVTNTKNNVTSDVKQNYTVSIATTGNLPLTFALAPSSGTGEGYALTQRGTEYFWSGGSLPHTTPTTHFYTLTITWPSRENDPKYAREVDAVTLTVDAVQADTAG